MIKKAIAEKCPSCQLEWKIVLRCKTCLKWCCIECSVDNLCIECYIDSEVNIKRELENYFYDKYLVKVAS